MSLSINSMVPGEAGSSITYVVKVADAKADQIFRKILGENGLTSSFEGNEISISCSKIVALQQAETKEVVSTSLDKSQMVKNQSKDAQKLHSGNNLNDQIKLFFKNLSPEWVEKYLTKEQQMTICNVKSVSITDPKSIVSVLGESCNELHLARGRPITYSFHWTIRIGQSSESFTQKITITELHSLLKGMESVKIAGLP